MSKVKTRSPRDRREWSLILETNSHPGSWNMAVDDFLFRSLSDEPQTYLRFYRWKRPTASLGYSQDIRRVLDVEYCQKHGIDIVRRMTGGKLVLHSREVTYSLCSSDSRTFTSTLVDSYRLISQALIRGLEKMGLRPRLADAPPVSYLKGNLPCFSYPARDEIEIDGKKIIGSAQRRTGSKFIQHGSIPLEEDDRLLEVVSLLERNKGEVRMVSLSQALGRPVSFDRAVECLTSGISEFFNVRLTPKAFNTGERKLIAKIEKERYANPDWTFGWG
ncbi:MAG: lipoate--protein ligase family protein [Candidatus Aminicenantes bacterium]|nr:lipoate--protein ligase family protein [Candidatus Aminicenantes bacterium]MDH5467476.1 lipoate--protein ligase family protein [Candidatus Aminicenantes bacterium]